MGYPHDLPGNASVSAVLGHSADYVLLFSAGAVWGLIDSVPRSSDFQEP